jgi:hypothetical protein
MSRGSAGIAVPEAVARERQMAEMAVNRVQALRVHVATETYTKIVASEYHLRAMAAVKKAEQEANPYGVRDSDEVEKEMPSDVPIAVDLNGAAHMSLQAADCLLFHLQMIDKNRNILMPVQAPPAAEENAIGEKRSGGGIILES